MKKRKGFKRAAFGYLGFFLIVAATVTAAVMIYSLVDEKYDGNRKAISIIMLVVCFGLTLICTSIDAIRRRYTVDRAVEQILEATEVIMSGNFSVRLTPRHSYGNYDDLDSIMQNINDMAEELGKNEVLKTDFISNVSHEIKTPLAVIQNYATALADKNLSDEKRAEYLKTLTQATKRLNDLVLNVLKLNKLENQHIDEKREKVRLDESISQTIFTFEELIDGKELDLQCDIDEVSVVTVSSYLEILWNNLLSNAIKFTQKGGKITVSLKKQDNNAVVKFQDTGVGMDKDTGRRIFDKFYQGDTSRKTEGNGLGLALVKKTVDLLGGEISVESQKGEGSTFTIVLRGALDE